MVPIDQINLNNTYPRVQFSDPDNERNFYALEVSFFNNEQFIYQDIMLSTDVLFNGNSNAFLELLSSTSGNRLSASLFNLDINSYKFYSKIIAQEDGLDDTNTDGP